MSTGFVTPPEWYTQDWLWVGFPHLADEWPGMLARAQEQIAAFASAVAESGQAVRLVVRDAANRARAEQLASAAVTIEESVYGDVWLRDTGPLVVRGADGARAARLFGFNGWGGKYLMPGDEAIGADLAASAGLSASRADWVLEGGALDGDGTGLVATTEQCLLNPNRNPQLSRADLEMRLERDLGYNRVLWLGDGLVNDHTDGHVDNLARFAPHHQWPGVTQPHIAIDAFLDRDCPAGKLFRPCAVGRIAHHQPHRLPALRHRAGKRRDLLLRAAEHAGPFVGQVWEADPQPVLRVPFGGKRKTF